jgi:erythromycin esterase
MASAGSADTTPAARAADARVAWLKRHVAPIRSLDPADEDFADLEPIRKAIGDARIVFLGEEWHGSGATFQARSRVIKFLHRKCGFDLLAFESGLYDCRKVWELLRQGKMPALDAAGQGVFYTWVGAEECRALFEYLGKEARTARPLEVCGFDCQFTGVASRRFLPVECRALCERLPREAIPAEVRAAAVRALDKLSHHSALDDQEIGALRSLHRALLQAKPTAALLVQELRFWRQFLSSSLGQADMEAAAKRDERGERNPNSLRDVYMARNLVWLAHDHYPRRKMIVWATCYHLMRNAHTVSIMVPSDKEKGKWEAVPTYPRNRVKTMANEAWKEIQKETYSIFFTAAFGEFQTLSMAKPEKLKPLLPGSLEDLLLKAGTTNGFFDLRPRGKDGRWLQDRLVARLIGDMDYQADWTKICDGVFFLKHQHGVTPRKLITEPVRYQPIKDPKPLGIPFDRYTTRDRFGRTVSFYLSQAPKSDAGKKLFQNGDATPSNKESRPRFGTAGKLPLAVFVQGSGCSSLFSRQGGKVYGGLQNLLLAEGQARFRVLAVEKPGVAFGDTPRDPGTALEGSAAFRREHTLPRWVEAVNAALNAAHRLEDVDWTRTLVVGHSEGGIVAAHVAARNPLVSHAAILASSGPSQLYDFLAGAPAARADAVRAEWAKVLADPDSADKMWMGHPYRRWSSFLKTSTLEGLLASRAVVFAAHGTKDRNVPIASFDVLHAVLLARGRDLTALRLEGRDHGFGKENDAPGDPRGMRDLFARVGAWFVGKPSPPAAAVKRELESLQGRWQVVTMNQEGEQRPLTGIFAGLQIEIHNDRRTLKNDAGVLAGACFRLNPHVTPHTMDIVVTQGAARGLTLLGIYELSRGQWRVCYSAPGRRRPRDFSPKPGSAQTLQECKRAAKARD